MKKREMAKEFFWIFVEGFGVYTLCGLALVPVHNWLFWHTMLSEDAVCGFVLLLINAIWATFRAIPKAKRFIEFYKANKKWQQMNGQIPAKRGR